MKLKLIILQVFFKATIFGYSSSCFDIHFTPYSGAQNFIFLQNGLEKIDNLMFPSDRSTSIEDVNGLDQGPILSKKEVWVRKIKSALFWIPMNSICVVAQHEVFGHGYRIRDLGHKYAKVKGYKVSVFGGATSFFMTNRLTTSQAITISIAGLEADAILANRIKLKWLKDDRIDGRQNTLYCMSSLSLVPYTWSIKKNPTNKSTNGNDVGNYLFYLNSTYKNNFLNYTRVRNLSLINLIDPFLIYTFLSAIAYNEFEPPVKIYMFRFGRVKYLPSTRLALSPFGLQGYLENFLLINAIPTYLYFKWGKNGTSIYYGIGIENQRVFNWKSGSLGFKMDLWRQPNILFQQGALSVEEISLLKMDQIPTLYPLSILKAKSLGAAFSIIGNYGFSKWPIRIFMELGYKTKGYLPGEALRNSPIARCGLSGEF